MSVTTAALLAVLCSCTACSPGYVMRAAYEQGKILAGRRAIEKVITDPGTTASDREKLQLVLDARRFAHEIGLNPGNSFTSYSDIGKDSLAWVVVGARKDSFALHTWWFPIVGRVPYKGFFDKADAESEGRDLEGQGYEAWVRDTDAFSTLGWFDDPLLSTTLKGTPTRLVNTVLHESVHTTVWIPNNVPFNESLANFVGAQAASEFFAVRSQSCSTHVEGCGVAAARQQLSALERERQFELAAALTKLYRALEALYNDTSLSSEQKIAQRGAVFETNVQPLRAKYPALTILKAVHNAEIMQLMLYNTEIDTFAALFAKSGGRWSEFLASIRTIQQAVEADSSIDPFQQLRSLVGEQP